MDRVTSGICEFHLWVCAVKENVLSYQHQTCNGRQSWSALTKVKVRVKQGTGFNAGVGSVGRYNCVGFIVIVALKWAEVRIIRWMCNR